MAEYTKKWNIEDSKKICVNLLKATNTLHENNNIHGNITPENIKIDSDLSVELINPKSNSKTEDDVLGIISCLYFFLEDVEEHDRYLLIDLLYRLNGSLITLATAQEHLLFWNRQNQELYLLGFSPCLLFPFDIFNDSYSRCYTNLQGLVYANLYSTVSIIVFLETLNYKFFF